METIAKMIEEICDIAGEGVYVKEHTTEKSVKLELLNSEIRPVVINVEPVDREYAYKQMLKGVKNYYKNK